MGNEGALAGFAPPIALNDAGLADNAVARDEPRKGIGAASGTDGPDCFPVTNGRGNPAVAGHAAFGNTKERAPDFQLERGGADESFQRDRTGGGIENGFGEAAGGAAIAGEFGMRPVSAEFGGNPGFMRNVVKRNMADAAGIPAQ